ncbi:MAG: BadF/BadG/BcrA/BcrD ATPase family protein [Terriglobia bacterium]
MSLFLAVDGGQTTTKALLADARGKILARASAGPSNHTEEPGGPERLSHVISGVISSLLAQAAEVPSAQPEFAAACFGMTGETRIKTRVLQDIVKTPHLSVVHDSVNALAGAAAGGPGIIVIAGTGSVARGHDGRGREMRVGGWGHLFGDEGSAYWIGREAVRAAARETDGFGPGAEIARLIFSRLALNSAYDVMEKYYSGELSREHLANLSVWVNEAATCGDLISTEILQAAGRHLAEAALAILSHLFGGKNVGPVKVCYTGGVFESRFVLSSFRQTVLSRFPQTEVLAPAFPPVFGSLFLAYRSAGIAVPGDACRSWMS